jgi:hypothetical protein
MDAQLDLPRSEAGRSTNAAENGSAATSSEHQPTPEPGKKTQAAPQLHKWVYQTAQADLTLAENLEKSKWEKGCCKCAKKNGGMIV